MSISISIIDSLKDSSLSDLVSDNTEVLLDNLLEDGMLKDIPIIGDLFKIINITKTVSNFYLAKKVLKFLNEVEKIPLEERVKFVDKIDNDPKFKAKIGEKILILLEKVSDTKKAEFLAEALKLMIRERINDRDFQILLYIIEQLNIVFIEDLEVAFKFQVSNIHREALDHFLNCGILSSNGSRDDFMIGSNPKLYKTRIGKIFVFEVLKLDRKEILETYIDYILNLDITKSIGNEKEKVRTFKSRQEARTFLLKLGTEHFTESLISGKQFMDRERKTRFRRTDENSYEFFDAE